MKQQDLDKLHSKIEALGKELRLDSMKQKSLNLHEKKFELLAKKLELEQDVKALEHETGPQEKAKLLEQVKEDNLETVAMDRKITDLEEESKKLKETIAQYDMDLDNTGGQQSEKNAKFEELIRRDREMQAFIDSFDTKMQENIERNSSMEKSIIGIMEKIKVGEF